MWPIVLDKEESSERAYDLPSRLLKDRIILCCERINSDSASSIISQLLFLEAENPKEKITMYINSPGGVITDGLAIYDVMKKVACPIETVCLGIAASMGAFLLSAGTKGMRYALPNSSIMIHQPLGGAEGQATDIEITAKRILYLRDKLYTIMANNSNYTKEEMAKACDRDNYLTPEEASRIGLIDEIIYPKGETNYANK